jgi:hypothetical protein
MDYVDIKGWVETVKATIGLLATAKDALPKGKHRDDVEAKLQQAEESMKRADALLAKELGLKLCDCEFPPHVMLWQDSINSHVCPNRRISNTARVDNPSSTLMAGITLRQSYRYEFSASLLTGWSNTFPRDDVTTNSLRNLLYTCAFWHTYIHWQCFVLLCFRDKISDSGYIERNG